MRIVDLHSHFPMHVMAGDVRCARVKTLELLLGPQHDGLVRAFQRAVLRIACRPFNYEGPDRTPAVTAHALLDSPVRVALSVLYDAFDEIRFDKVPPEREYFADVVDQLRLVEAHVASLGLPITIVRTPAQLRTAIDRGHVALIHAVEGGFLLGPELVIAENTARLADFGVAYITVAHLLYRGVATNSPAIPFLRDSIYHWLFHQPRKGLSAAGKALISAMVDNGILIDMTHMSGKAMRATFALLDEMDPAREVPVMVTHSACRSLVPAEYNLSDDEIRCVAERRGVIGLIACSHWMAGRRHEPKTVDETARLMIGHIERINDVAADIRGRQPYESIGIGSDQDGFIKPALTGLKTPGGYRDIGAALQEHYRDDAIVERICWGNAMDVLERGWKGAQGVAGGAVEAGTPANAPIVLEPVGSGRTVPGHERMITA